MVNSLLDKHDVILSVRAYLADRGYEASYTDDPYGITEELLATKDKNMFTVEAINDSPRKDADIIFAIGKLVKRMAKVGFWNYYGIAMPREYYKFLGDFEVAGLETLKVHLFLVDEYLGLKHLNPKQTIELVTDLKAGKIVNPDLMMTT